MSFKPFPVVNPGTDMAEIQESVLSRWDRIGLENSILNANPKGPEFVFLEGPPTANGRPHVGHVITRTVKDTALRYKTMRGFRILRRIAGWDCHGLAVEIEAEKHFGISQKQKIEELGIEKFNSYCRESAFRYIQEWTDMDRLLAYSVDHDHPYVTMNREYIERVWWAVKQFHDKGLLYKDYKIVPYCPRCGTPLASHELSQGYKDVKDPSIYIKFKEKDGDAYFLAWTTTPWTLPSNQFLAVSPDEMYALVRHDGEKFYVLSSRASLVFGQDVQVLSTMKGKELAGKKYQQLIPLLEADKGSFVVVAERFVGTEDGTGIVHVAPAFGQDDFEVGKKQKVQILKPVDETGKFSEKHLPWDGKFVKEADPEIIRFLKEKNSVFKSEKITHSYPFCYRCDSPILYYPLDTWFLSVSKLRDELVENNSGIKWYPDHLRDGRFGNFISEAKDWALSRNRYWGSPLPVWICSKKHIHIITSGKEILELTGKEIKDLHRPYIDSVEFACPKCGETMHREPYVMDTWFDSGSAFFAGLDHSISDKSDSSLRLPVDFISEAIDQTRGWYYALHVISTAIFSKPAFSNCITMDFVLDSQGKKMSKSKGNSVLAIDSVKDNTGDELRLFFSTGPPWKTRNYDRKFISELSRKNLYTLLNVYSFFASNANLDKFQYKGIGKNLREIDAWLVSKVNSLIKKVRETADVYMFYEGMEQIEEFIGELSNFYLRLSRGVFWEDEASSEKNSAYSALFFALDNLAKLLAPWIPFFSDYLYSSLNGTEESVHLQSFPEADESLINPQLEEKLNRAYKILELVRRARQEKNLKARHPLKEILIYSEDVSDKDIEAISSELNAKSVRIIKPDLMPINVRCRVNYPKVAPQLKGKLKDFEATVATLNDKDLKDLRKAEVNRNGFQIKAEDLIFDEVVNEGYSMESGKEGTKVFLNLVRDQGLMEEALAREIMRRIQVMRKDLKLQYDDTIDTIYMVTEDRSEYSVDIASALKKFGSFVKTQTLSSEIRQENLPSKGYYTKDWDIDGLKISIGIKKSIPS